LMSQGLQRANHIAAVLLVNSRQILNTTDVKAAIETFS
jgi:hypothetical protein